MATAETIPIIEEALQVGTRQVETGRVRVTTKTETVEELAEAELESSEVEVTRVPVNRQVDRAPDVRTEGDVTIVPVLEEVLVVEKRLVLKEELHIKRSTKTEHFAVPVTLRKQRVSVMREGSENLPTRSEPMADTSGTAYSNRTISAFFDTRDDAQSAIDRLKGLGLADGSVKLVRGDDENVTDRGEDSRGFWESLSDFFFPDDDRAAYAEGLRRGGFLVTATDIPSDKYSEALDILDDEGSIDVDARSAEWRNEGWSGSSYTGASTSASDYAVGSTGVSGTDYSSSASGRAATGETDLGGTAAVGGWASSDGASRTTAADRASGTASSWAASAENTARDASDKVSDWASSAKDAVSSTAETVSDKVGDWTSSTENRLSSAAGSWSSDTDRSDRDALADEAVTSSAAPVASGAARVGSTYDSLSNRSTATGDEEVIPVVKESLRVGKRDTDLGRVRVRSYTVEEPVSESVNLHDERVFIERRPVDRELSGTEAAFTDRTIEANEHREEAVVSKDARVTEEIALRKEGEDRTETVSDSVRRTEVEIEDERNEGRREGTTGTRLSDTDR